MENDDTLKVERDRFLFLVRRCNQCEFHDVISGCMLADGQCQGEYSDKPEYLAMWRPKIGCFVCKHFDTTESRCGLTQDRVVCCADTLRCFEYFLGRNAAEKLRLDSYPRFWGLHRTFSVFLHPVSKAQRETWDKHYRDVAELVQIIEDTE